MSVIVTDSGFAADDWSGEFDGSVNLDLTSDTDVETVDFGKAAIIRVDFPSFADGRGFTIAQILRTRGYKGRLRAKGHVIADQYSMARRSGFDEVEISDDLAARQPEDQWTFRATGDTYCYQTRLRG